MNKEKTEWNEPSVIFTEYKKGADYKGALGRRGLYEQNRINERFYIGDQWNGVQAGEGKPLIRYNIIKRIGEYKMAMVTGAQLSAVYTAEGVPYTREIQERVAQKKKEYRQQSIGDRQDVESIAQQDEINLLMDMLTDHYKVTAERVKFDELKSLALRKAYTTGTGILYTYWDDTIRTGQYADDGKKSPIIGDIRCEVLDVENVYYGDPTLDDVQGQPYILLVQRRSVDELKREARRNGRSAEEVDAIKADNQTEYMAGEDNHKAAAEERKATVITKLYKKYSKDGVSYKIMAVRVVEGAVIRPAWDTALQLYPIARINWESMANCAYGVSEVTHLVPNQIAINRAATASAEAVMMMGMPIMLVNRDVVSEPITNDPGQIVEVYGENALNDAIRYVSPPNFTPQFDNLINGMMSTTLSQAGANDAALGDMRPDNTSAIIAVREAATMPLQLLENRFYSFVEDVARIWAEYWVNMYGVRKLKMQDENGVWYIPFDGEKCKACIVNARVDVGPASLWSEITVRQTLDGLFQAGVIDAVQYLNRLPKGSVPEQETLIKEVTAKMSPALMADEETADATGGVTDEEMLLSTLSDDERQAYEQMSPEQKEQVLAAMASTTA